MKIENIIKRLEKGGLLKKDGTLVSRKNMLWSLERMAQGKREHPIYWSGRPSNLTLAGENHMCYIQEWCLAFNWAYKQGNDAPRGGRNGEYIELEPKSRKRASEIIREIKNYFQNN